MRDTKYEIRNTKYEGAFTLVELLVVLVISSVILTAVATLAFAVGTANDITGDTSRKQAQVRYATLRISELIRHCKFIYATAGSNIIIWKADDNGDNKIDSDELVYIEAGERWNYIQLREPNTNPVVLIPQCSNVRFHFDVSPPKSKFLSISFDLLENNVVRHYQINSTLRSWAGNLLNEDGTAIVSDDD